MKELNIEIAVKIYDYEELDAADRELMDATAAMPLTPTSR